MTGKNAGRVTVWRGGVYMAPLGFDTLGPDTTGRMIASDGDGVIVMTRVGSVLDDE